MNLIAKGFLCMLLFTFCLSCSQEGSTNTSTPEKVEKVEKEMTAKSENAQKKIKGKKDKGQKGKTKTSDYWTSLQEALNIDAEKMKAIRKLNMDNNITIQSFRKDKSGNFREQVKEIRVAEKKEVEKILGPEMYAQKLKWDKNWKVKNKSDEKR